MLFRILFIFRILSFVFVYFLSLAWVARFSGDTVGARDHLERSLAMLEADRSTRPEGAGELVLLSNAYAGLGQRENALRYARRALDLMPASLDPVAHGDITQLVAMTYTLLGETTLALTEWQRLLTMPYGASVHALRLLPYWAPLRADSDYAKLVQMPERYLQPLPLLQGDSIK